MAARIVTIAQQKGGAGKTTLAIHLAMAWCLAGKRVATVDIDPQGSMTEWHRTRMASLTNGEASPEHVQLSGWRVQKEVERLAKEYEVVVIDSPPHAETEAKIAVRCASLVVVPVQPSPLDLWATRPTLELAKAEKRKVLLVLNRVPFRGNLVDTVSAKAGELGVPVADATVGNRIGFAGAIMDGLSLMETDRRAKGVDEIEELAAEIWSRTE